MRYWQEIASDIDAEYDDRYRIDGDTLEPMITWGINPGQAMAITDSMPHVDALPVEQRESAELAYRAHAICAGDAPDGYAD